MVYTAHTDSTNERGPFSMKKIIALLLTLALCLSALSALAAEKTAQGLFTVTYDETRFTVEEQATSESMNVEPSVNWLFALTDGKVTLEAVTEPLDAFPELTLATATDDERQAYVDYFLDTYAMEDAKYEGLILTQKDSLPFELFTLEDEEGHYYYAETVVKGLTIGFYCYYEGVGEAFDPDDALYDLFATFLEGYAPAA